MATDSPSHSDFIHALNDTFARLAGMAFDRRGLVVTASALLVAGLLVLAGRAQVDNSYEAYFDPGDTAFTAYEQYRFDFGSDEISYILYTAPDAEHGVFDLGVMRTIGRLTEALTDEVPFVYDVRSLTNAELLTGTDDGIEIEKLEDDFPETQAELLAVRARFLDKPMLVGGLLSGDARYGAIVIEMDRSSTDPPESIRVDPEQGDALENLYPQATASKIETILARPEYAGLRFWHSGDVPLNAYYNRVINDESGRLQAITTACIALILAVFFRSAIGVLGPVVVVTMSSLAVVAFIAALGWKLDLSFSSIPTLITAIGVAHAVHILSEFQHRFTATGDRRTALVETMRLVGTPSLLTSLTTAAGFASMSFVPIKSIAHMGAYSAFGVLAAFVLSFTLLTSFLSFGRSAPRSPAAAGRDAGLGAAGMKSLLRTASAVAIRHRKAILAVSAGVFAFSLAGMAQIRVDSNWLDDFRDETPLKQITQRVDEVMGGTTNLIYLFETDEEGGIKEPAALREMERVQQVAERHGGVLRKSYSLLDVLKDLNRAFHGGDPDWYVIPESRELVAQYLLLYEMSGGEETEKQISSDHRRAGLELRLALGPTSSIAALTREVDAALAEQPLELTRVTPTGIGALWLELMDYIVSSQVEAFLIAFGVIAMMMIGVFRSWKIGLISMVPNLAPVFLTLGMIGWLDLALDYSKIAIAGVSMGIAVDDTIHLVSRFRHEFERRRHYVEALQAAMSDVGRALVITSVALVVGFLVSTRSELYSNEVQGLLMAGTIVTALIADFLLMPALILVLEPFGPEGAAARAEEEQQRAAA